MKKVRLVGAFIVAGLGAIGVAQQPAKKAPDVPAAAAAAATEQTTIDLYEKKITVSYSAPALKGRDLLGGAVPFKRAWPVGGKSPAILRTEGDLVFKGMMVPKGVYSLYLMAEPDKWQLIINKQTGQKAAAYNPKMDLGRVPMILRSSAAPVETCRVTLTKSAARAARLELALGNKIGGVPFALDWVVGEPEW